MSQIRVSDAATFLGVSTDTLRRWMDQGLIEAHRDDSGRKVVDGYDLAMFARSRAVEVPNPLDSQSSARNRFVGLVTQIKSDTVMAQVELQCGPFRVVSLMSSDSVENLGIELGSVAVAVVKSTMVVIEAEGEGQS